MGDSLSYETLASFYDELEKIAGPMDAVRGAAKAVWSKVRQNPVAASQKVMRHAATKAVPGEQGLQEAGRRLSKPLSGMTEGWRMSSPVYAAKSRAQRMGYSNVDDAIQGLHGKATANADELIRHNKLKPEMRQSFIDAEHKRSVDRLRGGGEHIFNPDPNAGVVKRTAERLSRAGWTGAGKRTKYLPVGMKTWVAAPPALAVPGIVNAPKPGPTSEGGGIERGLGELGMVGGLLMGTGLKFLPATALTLGAGYVGSRLGRVLDRVRGGANAQQALMAPSPEQAASQLQDIQKYYG